MSASSGDVTNQDVVLPPKLPVPSLEQTLQRYLLAIEAVVSKEKYDVSKEIVAQFGREGGEGETLQDKLVQLAASSENWVYDWWLDDMYFKVRLPLPINVNPGMVFPPRTFKNMNDLIRMAAHFVSGILDYIILLNRGGMPQEFIPAKGKMAAQPLCMAQYHRLFNTCRIPGTAKDSHLIKSESPNDNQHILVLYKRQFYVFDVIIQNERISQGTIESAIGEIVQRALAASGDNVGILTGDQRDRWARQRSRILKDNKNKESLTLVEQSLFVVCIDDPLPSTFNHRRSSGVASRRGRDDTSMATQMLYGGGSKYNSANRWFDQTLQLIFSTDGACGLCYEHSPAEGVVVIQLMDKLLKSYEEMVATVSHCEARQMTTESAKPRQLPWNVTSDMKDAIVAASNTVDKLGEDLDFYVLRFREYGSDYVKNIKMSPDAYIQLALQMTYYKVHRKLVSTYESASTRRFHRGRVDNIRAATPQALAWVRAMCADHDVSNEDKMSLFKDALKTQTEIMTCNIFGQGIDCHLLGLRELSVELGRPLPKIFSDESYIYSNQFRLSTSQVQTKTDSFMGYGAVIPDGYGASYNPHADNIVFCIASFHSEADTSSKMFAMSLESTLLQMKEMNDKATDRSEALN